jgi:hypothetical protein
MYLSGFSELSGKEYAFSMLLLHKVLTSIAEDFKIVFVWFGVRGVLRLEF